MTISIEKIIEMVTREVIKELLKGGVNVTNAIKSGDAKVVKSIEVDMSLYKTPILSENSFESIGSEINELIVPANTVITPGAAYEIKKREININFKK